jgi:hypothetical protein
MKRAPITIVEAMDDPNLFAPWFPGRSWDGWRAVLKGAFGLPMSAAEAAFFRSVAERDPPTEQVDELWAVAGRRAGKDSIASVIAAFAAALFRNDGRLRPGERAVVLCLATDRATAKIVLNYIRAFFTDIPMLRSMVTAENAFGFELDNRVDIMVAANSFRSTRGRPILCAILDETAFWRDENSAVPDQEVYSAIKPGLASIRGSMVIGISSPYRRSGLLFNKYKDHFGKPSKTLVIKAATRQLNPTIPQRIVDEAMAQDAAAASAEWGANFRDDISAFVTREAVEACVSAEVLERPRVAGVQYQAFCDPSGGSSDSMTLAVTHAHFAGDGKPAIGVLDAVREIRAPFSPEAAVAEFADFLKRYGVRFIRGDRYAAEWVVGAFRKVGIEYRPADLSKPEIYRDFLPLLNSRQVDLLDNARMITQLLSLERRTARGGRDSIDHPPGGHDDLANAVAGALVYLLSERHQAPVAQYGVYGSYVPRVKASKFDGPILDGDLCGGFAVSR